MPTKANNIGRPNQGITLIELLVTIAVLAVLVSIAAPSMARFLADWRASSAINAFTGSLRLARTEAIARARPVVMCRVATDTSTSCISSSGANGFASGWIVFVNNDGDGNFNYSSTNGDELLLRQTSLRGIQDITLTRPGRFVFLPNGLLNSNNNAVNIDANGYVSTSSTPWARKALCISKPGRMRHVADSADCGSNER
ncbi:GspH/FimT family pseudopilin [Melaminivora alkalimesophila]|uniref:GspH/FimT family pseudopilin n=1 Tax=Melaminivora alkalimesophila TaxID=1165852 RepID=UPI0003110194|nr:GspH/FimT family pseudopilin [Melaminivora alkalimesophila]